MNRIVYSVIAALGLSGCINAAITFSPHLEKASSASISFEVQKGASQSASAGHEDLLIAFPYLLTPEGNPFEPTRSTPQEEFDAAQMFEPSYELLVGLAERISEETAVEVTKLGKREVGSLNDGTPVVVRYTEEFSAGQFAGVTEPGSMSTNGYNVPVPAELQVTFTSPAGNTSEMVFNATTSASDTGDNYAELNVSLEQFDTAFPEHETESLRLAIFLADDVNRVAAAQQIESLLPVGLSVGVEGVQQQELTVADDCSNAVEIASVNIPVFADNSEQLQLTPKTSSCVVSLDIEEAVNSESLVIADEITWETTEEEFNGMLDLRHGEIAGFFGYILSGLANVEIVDSVVTVTFDASSGLDATLEQTESQIQFAFDGDELRTVNEGAVFTFELPTPEIPESPEAPQEVLLPAATEGPENGDPPQGESGNSGIIVVAVLALGGAGLAGVLRIRAVKSRKAGSQNDVA